MPVQVTVPKFGLTVTEVEVIDWLKAVGDEVAEGEPLVVVTADKADVEITAPATGVLAEISAAVGDPVDVGGVLGSIDGPGDPTTAAPAAAVESDVRVEELSATVPMPPTESTPVPVSPAIATGTRLVASPLARKEARELGVDLTRVAGSGPGGRIVRADVRQASASSSSDQVASGDGLTSVPLSPVRRVTARRMAASARTTAPASITVACDASQAVLVQQRARAAGVHATVTHLVMLATSRALATHPAVNGYFVDDAVVTSGPVNIGLAVDVDGDLMVPVVRDVAGLDLRALVDGTQAAVARARSGALTPDDVSGGTFTISNLGMFGVESFVPIINAPQIAILGVGSTRDEVVVVDGEVRVRPVLRLTLTFDHRAVDGAPAARFLSEVSRRLETIDSVTLLPSP